MWSQVSARELYSFLKVSALQPLSGMHLIQNSKRGDVFGRMVEFIFAVEFCTLEESMAGARKDCGGENTLDTLFVTHLYV